MSNFGEKITILPPPNFVRRNCYCFKVVSYLLPPANVVCEGYVFNTCLSFCSQGEGVSRPRPRGEVGGSGWGV